MPAFTPRDRSEIYATFVSRVLANAPLTSAELGEVVDNIAAAVADVVYEAYFEQVQALSLLRLETTTGSDLDDIVSDFPNMAPRFPATNATAAVRVTDPGITKIASEISVGGALSTNQFLNVDDTSAFPAAGTLLVGERGEDNFETVTYTAKIPGQFNPTSALVFDHAAGEPVVLTTVGDRVFAGPYQLKTAATTDSAPKFYSSVSELVIYDGEESGLMNISAETAGPAGNTPSLTINEFAGSPPFPTATVTNPTAVTNGTGRETDAELRSRIRQERQALSGGTVDAVYSQLNNVNLDGQRVLFRQLVEDVDPTLPALLYIDDGAAFLPTQTTYTGGIILEDEAIGGERFFHIPRQYLPIVATDLENASRIFSNITVELNGSPISQGDAPGEFRMLPDKGDIRLNTALSPNDELIVTSITHFTGLIQEASKVIYGDRDDRQNYPGIVGIGSWIQVRNPAIQFVSIEAGLAYDGSRSPGEVRTEVINNWLNYVNNLGIGGSVVRSRLIALAHVRGVDRVTVALPIDDIIIPSGTLARLEPGNINLG